MELHCRLALCQPWLLWMKLVIRYFKHKHLYMYQCHPKVWFYLCFSLKNLGNFEQKNCYICQVTSSLTAAKAAREHAISGAYHATAGKFFCLTFALVSSWSSFRFLFKWLLCLLLPWGVSVFAYLLNWVFYILYWNRCCKESKGIGGSCLFSAFYYVTPLLPCWASAGHLHGTPITLNL